MRGHAMEEPAMKLPDGVHKIRVPLAGSPLGWVNSYVIRGDDGYVLVDCGWDTPDALAGLRRGLADLGLRLEDLRTLVVTHNHPDHYGLAGRLLQFARCGIVMHRLDAIHIDSRYANISALEAEMEEWLRVHGVPREELRSFVKASEAILDRVNIAMPDQEVSGGERIAAGPMEWEIVWTPGHSAGHICLYERARRLFMSGDHILNPITPNVGLHAESMGNPLADYLSSLRQVRDYDVELVLPAHGNEFRGFRERIDELLAHHEERCEEVRQALADGPKTAYEVAARMRWHTEGRWEELPTFQRRMATTEALAHLELLHSRGELRRLTENGTVRYALAAGSRPARPGLSG
jgi:glyoxylase-like metal-dependent hydrolase (beta-lactamase superfamily II)